jgi:hypothetical protein
LGNLIDLTKKAGIVLEKKQIANVQAEIYLALDTSYSMEDLFRNGTVQEVVDRILGIGMNMDVNKSIEVFSFSDGAKYVGAANETNYPNFVKNKRIAPDGGTNYAPVMKSIIAKAGTPIDGVVAESKGFLGKLFGKKEAVANNTVKRPAIVFFITDGDNFDKGETERVIREAAKQGIFWQFVGVGSARFAFLQKLDDLAGRFIDNADFFSVNDISKISDEELYDRILNEIPGWLTEAKAKGLVR